MDAGKPVQSTADHEEWVLVAQDCDLAWNSVATTDSLVELRPVFRDNPPANWGIRDSRFRLDDEGAYLIESAPQVRVEPDVVLAARHVCALHDPDAARRLKTWLGLRYNRPAVPQEYVPLSRELARRLTRKSHKEAEKRARDILATFQTSDDGRIEFTLTAVIPRERAADDGELLERTRQWLAEVALAVPEHFGLNVDVVACTDAQVSLAFVETSFSLDVTTVSWPNKEPGPTGDVAP